MNLFFMPLSRRRGVIYALLALAEAGWIAPLLLSRINHTLTDLTGWFLTLLAVIGLAILLGWVTDVYRIPFEASRMAGMGLAAVAVLVLLRATLYPDYPFWGLRWPAEFVRGGGWVGFTWIMVAVGYIWWRCLYLGHTPPEPHIARFTLKIGWLGFTVALFFGGLRPQIAPSFAFLMLFVCSSLLAMILSHTQTVVEHHGEVAVGRFGRRLAAGGAIVALVLLAAMGLASALSLPVLNAVAQVLGGLLGLLLKPLAALLIRLVALLEPLFEWLVAALRTLIADSGMFDAPSPTPAPTPPPPENRPSQDGPVWWAVYTVWAWRGLAVLLVVWVFYRFTAHLGARYRRRRTAAGTAAAAESVSPEMPGWGNLFNRGRRKLAEWAGLVRNFGLGRDLRAAATIRRIYAALGALAAQHGLERPPNRTPFEFLEPLGGRWPDLDGEFLVITRAYVNVHYGQLPEGAAGLEQVRRAWQTVYRAISTEEAAPAPQRPPNTA
ncbi:MAG: DUF4129 domain-containing protein [Anaerolineae bacterium]